MLHRLGAFPERHRIEGEEVRIVLARLQQHDVALETIVGQVSLHAQLETRVQHRPEDLVHHGLQAAVRQIATVCEVGPVPPFLVDLVEEGAERIVTHDEVGAFFDRDVDVRGAPDPTVDVVHTVDARWLVEAR